MDAAKDNNGGRRFLKGASMEKGSPRMIRSSNYRFYNELEFEDKAEKIFGLERNRMDTDAEKFQMNSEMQRETGSTARTSAHSLGLRDDGTASSSSDDVDELNSGLNDDEGRRREENSLREEDLAPIQSDTDGVDLNKDEQFERVSGKLGIRRGKQVIRRSNLLAKQVISIRSAMSLGFVSQLWVDATSVGDVVLVQDESVVENEYRMVGLETLVGYKVVTPSQQNIGKVRGYTLNINSGAVEALELDSFGLSIIPSSLVSTYSLLVEDVLEVVSDAVVVHEAAASRIQRLSKGLLGNQNVGTSVDDVEDYSDFEKSATSGYASGTRRSFRRKKPNRRDWDSEEDWELPMDYL